MKLRSGYLSKATLSGVTMSLDPVWWDSSTSNGTCPDTNFCGATPCPNSTFDYLFDMSIGSGTTLNSLTLNISSGDSNSTIALTDELEI